MRFALCSHTDAHRNIVQGFKRGSIRSCSDHFAAFLDPDACLARPHRASERGGAGTVSIMAATSKSKTCVWRGLQRFRTEGRGGRLREKTRPPGTPKASDAKVGEGVGLTRGPPPHEATHRTRRAMGKAVGGGLHPGGNLGGKIWQAHGLAPQLASVQAVQ